MDGDEVEIFGIRIGENLPFLRCSASFSCSYSARVTIASARVAYFHVPSFSTVSTPSWFKRSFAVALNPCSADTGAAQISPKVFASYSETT